MDVLYQAFLASQPQFEPTEALVVERSSSQVKSGKAKFCTASNALPQDKVIGAQLKVRVGRCPEFVKRVAAKSKKDGSGNRDLTVQGKQDKSEASGQDVPVDVVEKAKGLRR